MYIYIIIYICNWKFNAYGYLIYKSLVITIITKMPARVHHTTPPIPLWLISSVLCFSVMPLQGCLYIAMVTLHSLLRISSQTFFFVTQKLWHMSQHVNLPWYIQCDPRLSGEILNKSLEISEGLKEVSYFVSVILQKFIPEARILNLNINASE